MTEGRTRIRWEPRVPQHMIRRLYQTDAQGIYDAELIDDIGFRLFARCQSFLEAEEARRGRAKCHGCGAIILHSSGFSSEDKQRLLKCGDCGWEISWGEYFSTIHKKQLSGGDLVSLFRNFVARFPCARSPREKMLLIDRLIHGFHYNLESGPRRPSGVNLIEGSMREVIAFLNQLTYGEDSTPEARQTAATWRQNMNAALRSWHMPTIDEPGD